MRTVKTARPTSIPMRPLSEPIHLTTIFAADSSEAQGCRFAGKEDGVYTRFGHPTLSTAAERIASLEGAETGLVFASGMAAISTTLRPPPTGRPRRRPGPGFRPDRYTHDGGAPAMGVEVTFVERPAIGFVGGRRESPSPPTSKAFDRRALMILHRFPEV